MSGLCSRLDCQREAVDVVSLALEDSDGVVTWSREQPVCAEHRAFLLHAALTAGQTPPDEWKLQ